MGGAALFGDQLAKNAIHRCRPNWFVLFFICAYLIPPMGGGDFALRPVYLLLPLSILLPWRNLPTFLAVYLLLLIAMLASLLFGGGSLNVPVGTSDYFEIARLLLPLAVFVVGMWGAVFYNEKTLMLLVFVIVAIVAAQYFELLSGLFIKIYSAESQIEGALGMRSDYVRLVGVSGNPNDAAVLFLGFQMYFFIAFLDQKKIRYLIFWLGSVLCLALTQSKTGYAALLLSIVFVLIYYRFYVLLWMIVFSIGAFFWIFKAELVYVWNFINAFSDVGIESIHVFSARLENALEAYDFWLQSQIFGWGPAKMIHPTVVDVEYALLLRRYGLLGVALLLLMHFELARYGYRAFVLGGAGRRWGGVIFFISPSILLIMFSNNFYSSYYNQLFWFFSAGIIYFYSAGAGLGASVMRKFLSVDAIGGLASEPVD